MTYLIQGNPYSLGTASYAAYIKGFWAGQKSTPSPISVTGRWWQAADEEIYFVRPQQYDHFQRQADNKSDCRWVTDEVTIELK